MKQKCQRLMGELAKPLMWLSEALLLMILLKTGSNLTKRYSLFLLLWSISTSDSPRQILCGGVDLEIKNDVWLTRGWRFFLLGRSIRTQQIEGLLQSGLVAMTLCMLWLLLLNLLLNDKSLRYIFAFPLELFFFSCTHHQSVWLSIWWCRPASSTWIDVSLSRVMVENVLHNVFAYSIRTSFLCLVFHFFCV